MGHGCQRCHRGARSCKSRLVVTRRVAGDGVVTTEVVHGPSPEFEHELAGGEYSLTLVGHYTTTPGWTCGGVTEHEYESDQGAKRLNELLRMRSIFHHWWLGQWAACGGELEEGARQLVGPVVQQFFAPPT